MLARWNPFDELMRDDFWSRWPATPSRMSGFNPAVDVVEHDDSFVLKAEMPGVKADEVDISLDGNVLTLKGERRYEHTDEEQKGYRRIERHYGSFQRSFTLPETVKVDGIEANLEDGLLTVTLPKKEAVLPRKIQVQGAKLADKAKKLFSAKGEQKGEAQKREEARA